MVPPACGGADSSPPGGAYLRSEHWLAGCDPTPGIVAVDADQHGRARIWRRVAADRVELQEQRFPNWFLATSLDLLSHLSYTRIAASELRRAHGRLAHAAAAVDLAVVELESDRPSYADAYRYLVLSTRMDELGTALVETANKRDGGDAQQLADLRGLVLVWHPVEQYLLLSGRSYFKGMRYDDLRRMQFDLETTGLDEDRHRIFMVSLRDSAGWQARLETVSQSEGELIERFVELVRERDPDVLENHNIFGFDLSFLAKRAARHGIRLALGRDGSEPELDTGIFDLGERPEPFVAWRVVGRQVIDTQHAVRRYAALAPDLRRHGLKDAARYFGLARADREYVPGAEVWPTYQTDPERIRRYAAGDVDEVDGLSRRLLPATFEVASLVPRAYERLAADGGPCGVWEGLLVRAYLHEGRAIPAPQPRLQRPPAGARSELSIRGVVGPSMRASLRPLLPSVMAAAGIAAANDDLGAGCTLLAELLQRAQPGGAPLEQIQPGAELLVLASFPYLAGQWLLSDPLAAAQAILAARQYVDRLAEELRARGCTIIELDNQDVVFATPADWSQAHEEQVAALGFLPRDVRVHYTGRYQALYARAPRSSMMLGLDGSVTLQGGSLRSGRLERFGERFLHATAACILGGDVVGARRLFLETVHVLRTRQLPLEELSVQVTLHRSPQQYRRAGIHEEPYEALLGAGVRSWRVGQRIRYFRAHGGAPRLLTGSPRDLGVTWGAQQATDDAEAADVDTEYYVQRLCTWYCQQFAQAFRRQDFARIFRLPAGDGPFAVNDGDDEAELRAIQTIAEPVPAPSI